MKIWKRRTALVLALVLLLSTGAMAAEAKYSSWFAPYYKEMQALGILPASFTTGDLTATITRGEMSELAVVAFEKATGNVIDELERTDYFTDTTDKNILKAHEYGIVSGYPDGTFQPDKTLTRQEFFKIIQNFCESCRLHLDALEGFRLVCGFRLDRRMGARGCAAVRIQFVCRRHKVRLRHLSSAH